jgi:hypothetical protein
LRQPNPFGPAATDGAFGISRRRDDTTNTKT